MDRNEPDRIASLDLAALPRTDPEAPDSVDFDDIVSVELAGLIEAEPAIGAESRKRPMRGLGSLAFAKGQECIDLVVAEGLAGFLGAARIEVL